MVPVEMSALGKKFYIILAGKTNDAHECFVRKFKSVGHVQVNSVEDCDYYLVFCPVATRVGTDIDEALRNIPSDKMAILVVMHHAFKHDHVVVDSSKHVKSQNVVVVDCLFHERNFLNCSHNDTAWNKVRKHLDIDGNCSFLKAHFNTVTMWKIIAAMVLIVLMILILIIIVVQI